MRDYYCWECDLDWRGGKHCPLCGGLGEEQDDFPLNTAQDDVD